MSIEMNVEHPHAEAGGLHRGTHQRARRIMKFKIEENFGATPANLADKIGTAGNKKLLADLEHADQTPELIDHLERFAHDRQGRAIR